MCKDTCFFLYCKLFPKKNTVIGSDVPLMKQSVGRSCNIVRIFVSGRFGAVGTVSGYSPHNGRNGLIRRDSHGCRAESVAGSCRDRTPYAAAVGVDGRGDADCRMMHRNPIGFVPRIFRSRECPSRIRSALEPQCPAPDEADEWIGHEEKQRDEEPVPPVGNDAAASPPQGPQSSTGTAVG